MDEMIKHFNDVVSAMAISIKDKMTILGLITAIGYKYQDDCKTYQDIIETDRDEIQWLKKCVNDLPAADVRPVVRAHWYWDKDGMDWNIGAWRCSACKAMSPMWWNADRGSPMHKSGHKFCPCCGAMMEGN